MLTARLCLSKARSPRAVASAVQPSTQRSFKSWFPSPQKLFRSAVSRRNNNAKNASTNAVRVALTGNILNSTVKFIAFSMTGSGTMFSEGLHSCADVANQSLLLIGVKRSSRPATPEHPYGFEGERFVYALISATGMFFLGACFSVYRGIHQMMYPVELGDLWLGITVLLISSVIESFSFTAGVLAVRQGAAEHGITFMEYLHKGPDPMGVAVVMEDGAALVGLFTALASLSATILTGNPFWDALGSVLIGGLLGFIAIFLIKKNASLLSGKTIQKRKLLMLYKLLQDDPMISRFDHVKAVQLGVDTIKFGAEIEFNSHAVATKYLLMKPTLIPELSKASSSGNFEQVEALLIDYGASVVNGIGDEVDRIEAKIQQKAPDVKHVELEPQ